MSKQPDDHATKRPRDDMTARLHHVSLPMPPGHEAAARQFYGELLGLVEMTPQQNLEELHELWFQLGGNTELHLFAEEPMGQDHSARHFCLAVADVEQLRARLEAAGIAVVGAPRIPGRPRYFCRDPFGNLVEITTIQNN